MSSDSNKAATSVMEEWLGPTLVSNATKGGKATKDVMKDKELVLLYFSAAWCPPCQAFSPMLIDFYKTLAAHDKKKSKVEIVYISSDKSIPEFEGYFGKMPWWSLPATGTADIKNRLAATCQVRGIPTLIALQVATGHYVSDGARNDIASWANQSGGADPKKKAAAAAEVVAKWSAVEAVPIAEANIGGVGGSWWRQIVATIVKNPAFIIVLVYIYRVRLCLLYTLAYRVLLLLLFIYSHAMMVLWNENQQSTRSSLCIVTRSTRPRFFFFLLLTLICDNYDKY